ncbi:hypothetical protein LINPERPRIM_LOCUS37501 [Linum perenne]
MSHHNHISVQILEYSSVLDSLPLFTLRCINRNNSDGDYTICLSKINPPTSSTSSLSVDMTSTLDALRSDSSPTRHVL